MSTTSIDADNANACFCVGCDKCLGNELSYANLELSHPNPTLFVTSQWRCPPVVYAVYRGVVALYFVTWIVLSGVWTYDWTASDSDRVKWFIYLTNWAFLILTLDVLLQAVLVAVAVAYDKKGECTCLMPTDGKKDAMPWDYKLTWLIHNVACNAALVTSFGFWVFIYKAGTTIHPVDWNTHCVNVVYVLVDTFITAIPLRLLHFYYGVTFGFIYLIFSVLYDAVAGQTNALGEPYIYSELDWSQPQTAVLYSVLVCLVVTPAFWLLLFALYKLRLALHRAVGHSQVTARTEH